MVAAGLASFSLLYTTQAMLPDIGRAFGVGATVASLTVSITTGVLALTVLPVSALAERVGRTRVMAVGLGVACLAALGAAASPDLGVLLAFRAVDGLALAGVVAVAVGHIGSSVEPSTSGSAIGVYVSGTSVGGLIGRLVPAGVSEFASWRWAIAALAVVGAICTLLFVRLVPAAPAQPVVTRAAPLAHLRNPGVRRMCVIGLLIMGGFVGTYNYLTYRLTGHPFDLSTGATGLVFLAYLSGTVSSTVAARLAARLGRRRVVLASLAIALGGLALTLSSTLPLVLVGLVVFTTGFFGAHAVASGWTSALAGQDRSHAAALYLMAYYLGSSIGGAAIGLAWSAGGWPATVACVAGGYLIAACTVPAAPSTGISRRSSVRRSRSSTVPSARPRPTMTMVGTPSSSASLNFTPGETPRRSS